MKEVKVLLITAMVTMVFIWAQWPGRLRQGGILDNIIMKKSDLYYQMDKRFQVFAQEQGLLTGEAISFVLPFDGQVTKADLAFVKKFTADVERAFPESGFGVISLATAANYRDTGEELLDDPYITDELLADLHWDRDTWFKQIQRDSGVYGLLIGRNFDYAQVILFLPRGFDEMAVFYRVSEFLEQRRLAPWERYLKTDIYPRGVYERVLPAGWVAGRGITSCGTYADIIKLSTIGVLGCFILFLAAFRNFRQAGIASLTTFLALVWSRGTLGVLQQLGFEIDERIYFVLVLTAQIIAINSFTERKISIYNELRGFGRQYGWRGSKIINGAIILTAIVASADFLNMTQIGVRGIMEVGVLSALGILEAVVLALWFMPALHIIVGGEPWIKSGLKLTNLLKRISAGLMTYHQKPHWLITAGLLVAPLIWAIGEIGLGHIQVRTRPLEYIVGTAPYRASKFLNQPGRYGFDRVPILVKPRRGNICQVDFIAGVSRFQSALRSINNVREVNSIVGTLELIASESYGRKLQATDQEVSDDLFLIDNRLDPKVRSHLWCDGGIVISASTAMEDSNVLGRVCEDIISLARSEPFQGLDISIFGKVPAYARSDKYIREGTPINFFTSQCLVIAICFGWLIRRTKKMRFGNYRPINWRIAVVMSIPFIFANSIIIIVMARLAVPLDQATACVTALAINAAVDFTIHLISDFHGWLGTASTPKVAISSMLRDTGEVTILDGLSNSLCFFPLVFSQFVPVARLGWIMITMLIACAIGALVIMPTFLYLCVKTSSKEH